MATDPFDDSLNALEVLGREVREYVAKPDREVVERHLRNVARDRLRGRSEDVHLAMACDLPTKMAENGPALVPDLSSSARTYMESVAFFAAAYVDARMGWEDPPSAPEKQEGWKRDAYGSYSHEEGHEVSREGNDVYVYASVTADTPPGDVMGAGVKIPREIMADVLRG